MPKIPIKIKKGKKQRIPDDLKLDLKKAAAAESTFVSRRQKAGLILLLILVLVIAGLLVKIFLFSPQVIPFYDDLVQQAVIFGTAEQFELLEQFLPWGNALRQKDSSGVLTKITEAIKRANLDFKQGMQSLADKQVIFALFRPDSQTSFPVVFIFKKSASQSKIDRALSQLEPELKKDYDFLSQDYRQIRIANLLPLAGSISWFYGQAGNYFIISNSGEAIKKVIDLVIKR